MTKSTLDINVMLNIYLSVLFFGISRISACIGIRVVNWLGSTRLVK